MGKQINFYMSKDVEAEFIEYLKQNNFIFLHIDFKNNKIIDTHGETNNSSALYLFKEVYGDIIMQEGVLSRLNTIKSPVIELRRTIIKEDKKMIHRGRIWVSNQYYDELGIIIKKNPQLIQDYNLLVRWIKKHVPYQEIKKEEHSVKEYVNDEMKQLGEKGFKLII